MRKPGSSSVWFIACSLVVWLDATAAGRGGWAEFPFLYCYDADAGEDAYAPAFNASGCLDGEWRRSNNSDQWDGSTPEPGDGAPGGAAVQLLPGEGDGGGDASVLSLEDVGDPRTVGFPDPGNRKIYLWRDTSVELDLARGVTLLARWRQNPEPRSSEFANNGGLLPVPNGTHLHDQNKGQIGFVQKSAVTGTLAATLAFSLTDAGHLQFAQAFNNNPCSGLFYPDELCLDVDETDWVSVWMTAIEEAGALAVKVYLNGDTVPAIDQALAGIRADAEDALLPEAGGVAASYINMALGSTGQDGAIQVDYVCVADGVNEPGSEGSPCPAAARAGASGRNVVLEWANGSVTPTSVAVLRDGVEIAAAAPADPPAYTDTGALTGLRSYELRFVVPGQNCAPLTTSIDTCPKLLTAALAAGGVQLSWLSVGEYAGLSLSRDGVVIQGALAGDATSYLDAGIASGTYTYSLVPTTGECTPVETTVRYFQGPAGSGNYNGVGVAWDYSLDPPPNADPALYLAHNPVPNEPGDLDGAWSSGNGSDSWDGSAPGEIGDPALDVAGVVDPASAAPGGIGLVNDGDVGAYLFVDSCDPTGAWWVDPSNRKLYLCYDASASIADTGIRSLINDGVTLRARFRLTPAARARDVAGAPNGYQTNNNGKGMFAIVHDAGVTLTGVNQRIAVALDLNPSVSGEGLLFIGDQDSELAVPIADPTQWLDLWMTAEDPDPATPEVDLNVYLNGSVVPSVSLSDFVPNDGGGEGGAAVPPGNVLYMGLNVTADAGSMEVDLVCLLDGARPPGGESERFVRGDPDRSGIINLTDGVLTLLFLFSGGRTPECRDAADSDDSGALNITDAIQIFNWLFTGGQAPRPPTPAAANYPAESCGVDPTDNDPLDCAQSPDKCQ